MSKETDHLSTYDSSFETAAVAGEEMKFFTSGSLTFIEVRLATVRFYNHLIYVQTYDMNDFPSENYSVLKSSFITQKKKKVSFFLSHHRVFKSIALIPQLWAGPDRLKTLTFKLSTRINSIPSSASS